MADSNEDSDERARLHRRQDFDDLQRELAGVNGGRMRRFFREGEGPLSNTPGRRGKDSAAETLLLARLADPGYRFAWERAGRELDAADTAARAALIEARRREAQAREDLEDIRNRAAKLPDGRSVFLTQDGSAAYDENGNRLTVEQMAQVQWRDGQPTWEEKEAQEQALALANEQCQKIEEYQEKLGQLRQRYEGGELSKAELGNMDKTLEADMPESVRDRYKTAQADASAPATARNGSVATQVTGDTGFDGQTPVRAAFGLAAAGVLNADELKELEPIGPAAPGAPAPG